jgi:hypothetical protein
MFQELSSQMMKFSEIRRAGRLNKVKNMELKPALLLTIEEQPQGRRGCLPTQAPAQGGQDYQRRPNVTGTNEISAPWVVNIRE